MNQDQDNWLCFDKCTSLKSLSNIPLAATLWDSPSVKEEIEVFAIKIIKNKNLIDSPSTTSNWWEITQKIVNQIECLNVPHNLLFEIKRTVIFMGQKILLWIINIFTHIDFNDIIFDVKYFKKIFWTPDGLIDELKIFQYWRNKYPNFPGFSDHHRNKVALYYLACCYWDKKYLEESLSEIGEIIKFNFDDKEINSIEHAMHYVLVNRNTSEWRDTLSLPGRSYSYLEKICFFEKDFDNDTSSLIYMLTYLDGSDEGIKYFSKKLDKFYMGSFLSVVVPTFYIPSYKTSRAGPLSEQGCHKKARILHMLLTLPSRPIESPLCRKNAIISNIFYSLLTTWPYQNLCIKFLDHFWNNLPPRKHLSILDMTLKSFDYFSNEYIDTYKFVQMKVLKHVLAKIPELVKLQFFLNSSKIYKLFKKSDYSSISVIVNDLKKYRYYLLDIGQRFVQNYLKTAGNLENVKEYVRKLNFSRDEKHKFSDDLLMALLCSPSDFLNVVDEILKWKCESDEEIVKTKIGLDSDTIVLNLVMHGKYELIDKYINWQCEESEVFKSKIFFNKLLTQRIFWCMWLRNGKIDPESTKVEFLKFLEYFLKTEEEIILYKNEKLIEDENFMKILTTSLLRLQNNKLFQPQKLSNDEIEAACWPDLKEVFTFCSISDDRVREMKKKIKDDFDSWYQMFDLCGNKTKEFLVLNVLVKWVSDSDEEMELVVKKYLDFDVTARFLYFAICKSESEDVFSKAGETVFLREWVSRYGDNYQIRERVKCIDNITENDVIKITELLNRFT